MKFFFRQNKESSMIMAALLFYTTFGFYNPQLVTAYISTESNVGINKDNESDNVYVSEEDKKIATRHYRRGKNLMIKKEYDEALNEFRKALTFYPQWSQAMRALSWAKLDKERKELEENADSSNLQGLVAKAEKQYNLGKKLEQQGKPIEAAAAYKAALRIISGYPEALAALDRLQLTTQQSLILSRGTTNKRTSRTHSPSYRFDGHRSVNRENVVSKIKENAKTRKTQMETKPAGPIHEAIQSHYLSGTQAIDLRDYKTAIAEFELILEFMPNHNKALFKLNIAKKKLLKEIEDTQQKVMQAKAQGDTFGEISGLRKMIKMDPNNHEVIKAWEQAKKNKKQVVKELYHKGVDAYAQGKYKVALKTWDLVLDLDPKNKKARQSIIKVREKLEVIKE